jgi:hypothetical protein
MERLDGLHGEQIVDGGMLEPPMRIAHDQRTPTSSQLRMRWLQVPTPGLRWLPVTWDGRGPLRLRAFDQPGERFELAGQCSNDDRIGVLDVLSLLVRVDEVVRKVEIGCEAA